MSEVEEDNKPPVFNSWRGWYVLVMSTMAILVILLYLFTQAYS